MIHQALTSLLIALLVYSPLRCNGARTQAALVGRTAPAARQLAQASPAALGTEPLPPAPGGSYQGDCDTAEGGCYFQLSVRAPVETGCARDLDFKFSRQPGVVAQYVRDTSQGDAVCCLAVANVTCARTTQLLDAYYASLGDIGGAADNGFGCDKGGLPITECGQRAPVGAPPPPPAVTGAAPLTVTPSAPTYQGECNTATSGCYFQLTTRAPVATRCLRDLQFKFGRQPGVEAQYVRDTSVGRAICCLGVANVTCARATQLLDAYYASLGDIGGAVDNGYGCPAGGLPITECAPSEEADALAPAPINPSPLPAGATPVSAAPPSEPLDQGPDSAPEEPASTDTAEDSQSTGTQQGLPPSTDGPTLDDSTLDTTPAPQASALGGAVADTGDTPAPAVPPPTPAVASPLVSTTNDDDLSAAEIVGIVLGIIVAIPTIGAGIAKMYTCVKGWRKRP
mmetsp:Transcript_6177/g.17720  ORF Transcript_6177/g.17720 Transcript_6177/m.17720 type:complete len:454 (-) Transcript_6177:314-1675(-)